MKPAMPTPVCTYKAPDGLTDWPAYSFEQMQEYARALLSATQPAAVDREAVASNDETVTETCPNCLGIGTTAGATYTYCCVCNKTGKVTVKRPRNKVKDFKAEWVAKYGFEPTETDIFNAGMLAERSTAPLDKDASKPAALDRGYVTALVKRMQDYCDSLAPPLARGLMAEAVRALVVAPSVEQDERGAFEQALKAGVFDEDRLSDYSNCETEAAWRGWQARAASTSANVAQGAEVVALWAAFDVQGQLLAHSKLRPGLSEILNWEPLYRAAPPELTDEQIIERCKTAGIKWIPPEPDDQEGSGFPGMFDMATMDEMRAALTATQSASGDKL